MTRTILALALTSLGALSAAQETGLHKKVTVNYDRLPLVAVLKDLGERAGVRFTFAGKLPAGFGPVTYAARDQEVGRVATRIVRPRRLRLEQAEGSVVRLVRLDWLDEFRAKREESFEFAERPKVTREGDKVAIGFETKAFCDVTVAIENSERKIVRHLASGVLGDNAPEPFLRISTVDSHESPPGRIPRNHSWRIP